MRKYKLNINDNSYEVVVKKVSDQEATVEVNGENHVVSIEQIQSLVLPETVPKPSVSAVSSPVAGKTSPVASTVEEGAVVAPMPGQIKAILVREGDRVAVGQKILVMEAMKLENKLPANKNGIVKKIMVRDGDIVSQGHTLAIIE